MYEKHLSLYVLHVHNNYIYIIDFAMSMASSEIMFWKRAIYIYTYIYVHNICVYISEKTLYQSIIFEISIDIASSFSQKSASYMCRYMEGTTRPPRPPTGPQQCLRKHHPSEWCSERPRWRGGEVHTGTPPPPY